MYVNVRNGTHAGWRTAKQAPSKQPWSCSSCGALNAYYFNPCPVCGQPRPE